MSVEWTVIDHRILRRALVHAAGLVESGWTQGKYARNAAGEPCNILDPEAECFCMIGALTHGIRTNVKGSEAVYTDYQLAGIKAIRAQGVRDVQIGNWNDRKKRTQAEVVSVLRQAAESLS